MKLKVAPASSVAHLGVAVAAVAGSFVHAPAVVPVRSEPLSFMQQAYASATTSFGRSLVVTSDVVTAPYSSASDVSREDGSTGGDDLMTRVLELRSVAGGALGPGSNAVDEGVLSDLMQLGSLSDGVAAVPTYSGSVALEWRSADVEYTAEIQPGHRLFLCTDNTSTDELDEVELVFDIATLRNFLTYGSWER